MNAHFAMFLVLAAELLLASDMARAQSTPAPPRMFSQGHVESLKDIIALEESDVDRLERQLATNPDDLSVRLRLMAYHGRADRADRTEDQRKRLQHAFWLIEHHADSEILRSSVSRFPSSELSADDYRRAVALWSTAVKESPGDAAVLWNAASFFNGLDRDRYVHYLEAVALIDPNHRFAIRPLAHYYALSILEGGMRGTRSLAALEASNNVWILSNAANMLQNQYNHELQLGNPKPYAAELAEHFFRRALTINPSLDRKAILPQIDLQEIARTARAIEQDRLDREARSDDVARRMRRLAPEAFPGLPAAVAGVLRARNCKIPQPTADGKARNVIRGEFFARGERGWAVFCSANGSTALLAFRNDHDTNPDALSTREDRHTAVELENGITVYVDDITAVGRDFIVNHYRTYGGPKPPPIDHQGIDVAILDKASMTWYFHEGKWMQLTGAD